LIDEWSCALDFFMYTFVILYFVVYFSPIPMAVLINNVEP